MTRRWPAVWHCWLTTVAASFAALETRALLTDGEPATLTAHLRRTLGLHPRRRHCHAGQALLVAVLGWLLVHLALGCWPRDGWTDRRRA